MKRLIIATTIALGLACVSGASAAQDRPQTKNLQQVVTVTASPGQYETYIVNLNTGYDLEALVGNTHRQYMQAQRAAESSEALRKKGMAQSPFVAVAIDNSSGPGVAKRFLLLDATQNTVAIVDAVCKQVVSADGNRCLLVSRPVSTNASSQSLASRDMRQLHLVAVASH